MPSHWVDFASAGKVIIKCFLEPRVPFESVPYRDFMRKREGILFHRALNNVLFFQSFEISPDIRADWKD